ncbi:ATP-binding protein [Amycolatopsis aidingensis]|uniref:ATP-binding protein n=1 Tax=Amycolatopsis aidingensis TaxID=2842453 RepID=UPI001E3DBF2A|nr:tetratricopeptide repeat protein [Amycolatopsis aidingensis]
MSEGAGVRNEAGDGVAGSVVQAGSIQHVSFTGTAHGGAAPPPRQLPLAIRDFTGRAEHVAALDALVPGDEVGAGAVVVSAVDGAAGMGKTTLAVHWAHRVQDRFPGGTLYVNLRGYGPGDPATPGEVLEGFLRALGLPGERVPVGVEAQAGLFRSLLAGRRVLVVLDNANGAGQVRPLLPGSPGCLVVVTSRDSLTGLVVTEGAARLTLDLLTEPEAVALVGGIVGAERAAAEPGAVRELVRCCGRLPLAVRIAAGYAAAPHTTVGEVVAELADERSRLEMLSRGGDERAAVESVFDWSYQRLDSTQALVFRRVGLHPGPEFCLEAVAAATGLDLPVVRRVLGVLVEAHLVEPVGRGRYRLHDLLRAYAAHRATLDDPSGQCEAVRERVWQWYAHHAKTAHQVLRPAHRDWYPALRLDTATHPELDLGDPAQASAWLEWEQDNLVAAVRDADRHGHLPLTLLLTTTVWPVLYRVGRWEDRIDLTRRAVAAARRGGDRTAETHALLDLGEIQGAVGRWQDARETLLAGLALARDLHHPELQACALNDLGWVCLDQGHYTQAREYFLEALPLAPGAQHGRLEAVVEGNLSAACAGLGDYHQALHHAERSLPLRRQAHDRQGEAWALHQIARARRGLGDHPEAIALCEQALHIEDHHRSPDITAATLDTLGTCLRDTGHRERALRCWREALDLYHQLGHHRADDLHDRLYALEATDPGLPRTQ